MNRHGIHTHQMCVSGGKGDGVSGIGSCAGVLEASRDGDQLAARACQVDEVKAERICGKLHLREKNEIAI